MRIRAALIHMLASRLASLLLMIAGLAVLGRLLEPADFGHFALAAAIFALAQALSEFGLRQHLICSEAISRDRLGSAIGLSLAIAAVLCVLCLGATYSLSGRLLPVPAAQALVPLSLALLLAPLRLGAEVMLQRSLDFSSIAFIEVVRIAADVGTAITLALLGYGPLALALGLTASQVAALLVLLIGSGTAHRIRPRLGDWSDFLSIGRQLTTIQILPKLTDLALTAILTGVIGAAALGIFNRAQVVHRIIDRVLFEGIQPVILPALSNSLRRGMSPLRLYFLKLDYLASICWPGFALIALLAEPLVELLLGPGWELVVPIVRILALGGLAMPFTKMSTKLFLALDETAVYLRILTTQQGVRLILCAAAAFVSIEAFAAAYVLGTVFKAFAVSWVIKRRFGSIPQGYWQVAVRASVVTATTLAGGALALAAGMPALPSVALALLLGAMGWLGGLLAVRHLLFGQIRAAALDARRFLLVR